MSEIEHLVGERAYLKVSLEDDLSNLDFYVIVEKRGAAVNFIDGVTCLELVCQSVIPVLRVVSIVEFCFLVSGSVESKLIRDFDIGPGDFRAIFKLVSNVADSGAVGHTVGLSKFSVHSLKLDWVINLVERLHTVSQALLEEVPRVRLHEAILDKDVLRLDAIDIKLERCGRGQTCRFRNQVLSFRKTHDDVL